MSELAACLVAGLALLSSGQNRLGGPTPIAATQTVAVASDSPMAGGHPVLEAAASARWTPSTQPRQAARRVPTKRAARPVSALATRSDPAPGEASRGRLERLHLGWLRTRIIIRDDL